MTREGGPVFSPPVKKKNERSSEMYYQVNRVFCAALSDESVNPQRIVFGLFLRSVKRDAGDAQAVASWKKSFVRSSTGEEDATSTTVAASATAYDVDGPRRVASDERRRQR